MPMGREVRAVLFDMDNTLYNFVDAKIAACGKVVEHIGIGQDMDLFRYFLRNIHGFEHHDNIRDFLHDNNIRDRARLSEACDIYEQVKLACIEPYPGVEETLTLLKRRQIPTAIVTDAERIQAERRLEKIGFADYFHCVVTPDISGRRKPEPESFLLACTMLDIRPEDAWLVGDSLRREIAPGNLLGMTTVYARYGDWVGVPSPSIRPDYTLNAFSELIPILGLDKKSRVKKEGMEGFHPNTGETSRE
jgi:putative hydrolase of the HAD superfamily